MKTFPSILLIALASACGGDPAASSGGADPGASGPGGPDHLSSAEDLPAALPRFIPDESWTTVPPSKGMRLHQYQLPGADGGVSAAGEVVVAAWPKGVGGLEANLSRWIRQAGMDVPVAELTEEQFSRRTVRGFEVSVLRLDGGAGADGDPAGAHGAAGRPMTVAYIEKPGHPGVWTVKLTGPIETIQAQGAAFDAFLDRL